MQQIKETKPEVLFLDLNLGDSYMTGMVVAFEIKLPILFVNSIPTNTSKTWNS
ncbi:hypothetical protein QO200_12760 [Flavobacterium sp. Arc3]|uniref:hypothetical protein n=1 Tax=Flavobacterium sp. Arc3 TaxID=3046686 RepID=UPI00352F575C